MRSRYAGVVPLRPNVSAGRDAAQALTPEEHDQGLEKPFVVESGHNLINRSHRSQAAYQS